MGTHRATVSGQPEALVGTKPSNNFQRDRPESGGADRDQERERSGLLDREKQAFAEAEQEKRERRPQGDARESPPESEQPPTSRR
jgi:hypothetical protein